MPIIFNAPTLSQRAAIETQNRLISTCLDRSGVRFDIVDDGYAPAVVVDPADASANAALNRCGEQADRASVAPAVQLFLGSSDTAAVSLRRLTTPSTLLVVAAIIAGASVLALVSTLAITRPLRLLAGAAHRISGGDFHAQVPAPGRGEVAQVAMAFNAMAQALERTEAQRQRMVNDIAHELRNPLVTLTGTLEAIQDEVYEPSAEVIDSMAEEACQLSHLVSDLQVLAAAESGHLRLARSRVDLSHVARTVAEAHTVLAHAADLHLQVLGDIAAGAALVVGDEVRLRQVLTNLVSNAIRYSPADTTVSVSTTSTSTRVRVQVQDQGAGIATEQLPFIFDRFWRADAARARATGGTGLGLAISGSWSTPTAAT